MKLPKKDETKAEILNKLQSINTLLEQWEQKEKPSLELLRIAKRDFEKALALIGGL